MSQGFSFGFSQDDAETSEPDVAMANDEAAVDSRLASSLTKPQLHSLEEMLASLPSSLSYSVTAAPIRLPRRELFDIRAQLMTEADPSSGDAVGLNAEDIEPGVYEGGFKTWECAVDLARFVLGAIDRGEISLEGRNVHIIELGAGTALPSCAVLHRLLTRPVPNGKAAPSLTLTVADYNASVLSLATGPNLFLTSLAALDLLLPEANADANAEAAGQHADVEPSPALLLALRQALARRGVTIEFASGAWGQEFTDLITSAEAARLAQCSTLDPATAAPPPLTLLLASETIYQPAALPAFVDTLLGVLRAAKAQGHASGDDVSGGEARAYVAAKRVYFGVGGGVHEFVEELERRGVGWRECWGSETKTETEAEDGDKGRGRGVGRCILEIRL